MYNILIKTKEVVKIKEDISEHPKNVVGTYSSKFNDILGINIEEQPIYQSDGLEKHMKKRKHFKELKYLSELGNIIKEPDYIGINPNEEAGSTVELIKKYNDNILVGIKLDMKKKYLFVSTMYSIADSKIQRRLNSGRIKEYKS